MIQTPKTQAAIRDVDVTSELANMLREFAGNRSGLLFVNERGKILAQSNLLQRSLHPLLKELNATQAGFHAFRRFRTTHLRKERVPEDLLRFWIGHGPKTITDIYSQLKADAPYRLQVTEQIGLGFSTVRQSVETESGIEAGEAQIAA